VYCIGDVLYEDPWVQDRYDNMTDYIGGKRAFSDKNRGVFEEKNKQTMFQKYMNSTCVLPLMIEKEESDDDQGDQEEDFSENDNDEEKKPQAKRKRKPRIVREENNTDLYIDGGAINMSIFLNAEKLAKRKKSKFYLEKIRDDPSINAFRYLGKAERDAALESMSQKTFRMASTDFAKAISETNQSKSLAKGYHLSLYGSLAKKYEDIIVEQEKVSQTSFMIETVTDSRNLTSQQSP
jgi:hypothetical protein